MAHIPAGHQLAGVVTCNILAQEILRCLLETGFGRSLSPSPAPGLPPSNATETEGDAAHLHMCGWRVQGSQLCGVSCANQSGSGKLLPHCDFLSGGRKRECGTSYSGTKFQTHPSLQQTAIWNLKSQTQTQTQIEMAWVVGETGHCFF